MLKVGCLAGMKKNDSGCAYVAAEEVDNQNVPTRGAWNDTAAVCAEGSRCGEPFFAASACFGLAEARSCCTLKECRSMLVSAHFCTL